MRERKRPAAEASPLRQLIGKWQFEATKDGRVMGRGATTFEWTEEGAFVLQRADDEPSPDADRGWVANSPMPVTAVIGFDDTTQVLAMLYADARGVARIYQMSLDEVEWKVWRAAPGFHQRFIGAVQDDGRTIDGGWESSEDGSSWEPDFEMTYRRVDEDRPPTES